MNKISGYLTNMLDTIPDRCAKIITAQVCNDIHNTLPDIIEKKVIEQLQHININWGDLLTNRDITFQKADISQPVNPQTNKLVNGGRKTKKRFGRHIRGKNYSRRKILGGTGTNNILQKVDTKPELNDTGTFFDEIVDKISGQISVDISKQLAGVSEKIESQITDNKVREMLEQGFKIAFEKIFTNADFINNFNKQFDAQVNKLLDADTDGKLRNALLGKCDLVEEK